MWVHAWSCVVHAWSCVVHAHACVVAHMWARYRGYVCEQRILRHTLELSTSNNHVATTTGLCIHHMGTASKATKLFGIPRSLKGLEPGWKCTWPFLLPWIPIDSGHPLVRVWATEGQHGADTFHLLAVRWWRQLWTSELNSMHKCCPKCVLCLFPCWPFEKGIIYIPFYRLRRWNQWGQFSSPLWP